MSYASLHHLYIPETAALRTPTFQESARKTLAHYRNTEEAWSTIHNAALALVTSRKGTKRGSGVGSGTVMVEGETQDVERSPTWEEQEKWNE